MPGDPVHSVVRLTEWQTRVRNLRTLSVRLTTKRDGLTQEHEELSREIVTLSDNIGRYSKTGELLHALMDKLVFDQVKAIEHVVTDGLRSIFFDQTLSFETEVGQSRGKIAIDLFIRRADSKREILGAPLETFGGGVSSIAALTLRLLTLMRLKKFPVLLLDETLSSVGDHYVENTGIFLARFSEEVGIPILLVTHNPSFLDHAKVAYEGFESQEASDPHLGLRRIRGTS